MISSNAIGLDGLFWDTLLLGTTSVGPCLLAPNDAPSHKIIPEWFLAGNYGARSAQKTSFPREPFPSWGEHLTACVRACILSLVTVPDP